MPFWLDENDEGRLATDYKLSEKLEDIDAKKIVIENLMVKFFSSVRKNTNVDVPLDVREEAIKEYFED